MKSLEESNSDVIYCPAGYWYSPVLTIYKDDMPIHTSCILHTHFKAVTKIRSKEFREYKSSLNKNARGSFLKRETDQKAQLSVKKPRNMANFASKPKSTFLPSPSIPGVTTLPPIMSSPGTLGSVPVIPPAMNPFLFNMPLLQYQNPFFCNPMGSNLLNNVFHSPSITPSTNSATPTDKATDKDEEEEEKINVTDL